MSIIYANILESRTILSRTASWSTTNDKGQILIVITFNKATHVAVTRKIIANIITNIEIIDIIDLTEKTCQ